MKSRTGSIFDPLLLFFLCVRIFVFVLLIGDGPDIHMTLEEVVLCCPGVGAVVLLAVLTDVFKLVAPRQCQHNRHNFQDR